MKNEEFRYINKDTKLTDFIPIPASLVGAEISSTALLMYGELLCRTTLSQKNDWIDEFGHVFLKYTEAELAKTLNRSESQVKRLLKELQEKGLIDKQSQGRNSPNKYWVKLPQDSIYQKKAVTNSSKGAGCGKRNTVGHIYDYTGGESI